MVDTIPTLAWSARSDGSADFFNQRWLDYTGLLAEQARDWGWTAALHPDDLSGLMDYWRSVLASGEPGETAAGAPSRRFLIVAEFKDPSQVVLRQASRSGVSDTIPGKKKIPM